MDSEGGGMKIPSKIHFVWVGPPMPDWAARNIQEFRRLNPDHEVIVHGRDAMHPDYERLIRPDMEPCEVADLVRYSVMERDGGWYFDCDYWPMRPVADIESAYALTGEEMFIAEVWPLKTNPGWLGNAILSSRAGHPLWTRLREMALEAVPDGRLTYGPRLIRRLYDENQGQFILAAEPWFNGPKANWSTKIYRSILSKGNSDFMRGFDPRTGGQKPFAMHLWAWKYGAEIAREEPPPSRGRLGIYGKGNARHAAVLTLPGYKFDLKDSLFTGIGKGLSKIGFQVDMLTLDSNAMAASSGIPDLLVAWNGFRDPAKAVIDEARRLGAKVLILEQGFWNRAKYTQADPIGSQHRALWASRLRLPAPPDGAARLAKFYPQGIKPIHAKKGGYVLVLGQVAGDTQLLDSEIQGPLPLQRAVKGAIPAGVQVYFRPHPQTTNVISSSNKAILPILGGGDPKNEANAYARDKSGPGLAEALAGARFVILINSTAGNEALAAGVPVLALGPALFLSAGVARQARVATLKNDVDAMLAGWCPKPEAVENYLRWLAARQWNPEEFAAGPVMRQLVGEAGIAIPEPVKPSEAPEPIPEPILAPDAAEAPEMALEGVPA